MPAEQADSSALPLDGRLGDPATLPRLYSWLSRGEWSGMVVLRAGDVERRIYFVEGRVGTAGSNDPADSLAQALIKEGLLTEEERSRAAGQLRATDRGWNFGKQLARSGMIQEKDLARIERRRVIQLVEATLALRSGTYACEPGTVAGDAQPQQALEIPRLVAEGVLTFWDANSALEALGGRDALLDLVVEHLPEHEATGAEEAYDYTLLLCNGKRSVAEVMAQSPLPEAASLRFLAALRLLDIVSSSPAPAPAATAADATELSREEIAEPAPEAVAEPVTSPPPQTVSTETVAARDAGAPAPPARAPEPEVPRPAPPRPPAPERAPPAARKEPGSRIAWVVVIIAVLVAATAFFLWVGFRQFSMPEEGAPPTSSTNSPASMQETTAIPQPATAPSAAEPAATEPAPAPTAPPAESGATGGTP